MTSSTNNTNSLATLFNQSSDASLVRRVRIPIIQRDYAQGRKSAQDVRDGMLSAIKAAYDERTVGNNPVALNFDFIYGYEEVVGIYNDFCPIDGQQRITTLFLLHWYAAWLANAYEAFALDFTNNGKAKLVYDVRASTADFLNQLVVCWPPKDNTHEKLSTYITNQPWYFRSWKNDPSIKSALRMLDAMHQYFNGATALYGHLVDPASPLVTFQMLTLREYGLSDDLYIKLNARGKPLTALEQLKAKIEQYIAKDTATLTSGGIRLHTHFITKIETKWADFFWQFRDIESNLYDKYFMHFFRNSLIVQQNPHKLMADYESVYKELSTRTSDISFQKLDECGLISSEQISLLITVLDAWSEHQTPDNFFSNDYFDEYKTMLDVIGQNPDVRKTEQSYEERIIYYSYIKYIQLHGRITQGDEAFSAWIRVCVNLAKNTIYHRPEDFARSIRFINSMLPHSGKVIVFISQLSRNPLRINAGWFFQDTELDGSFNEQQTREEVFKAQLLRYSDAWRAAIERAEQMRYFRGQIESIFYFSGMLPAWLNSKQYFGNAVLSSQQLEDKSDDSIWIWTDEQNDIFLESFERYREILDGIFDGNGLKDKKEYLWERALLSKGDYLLPTGQNHSLLTDNERSFDWRRLFRGNLEGEQKGREIIKHVLDAIDSNAIQKSLRQIIRSCKLDEAEAWREMLASEPKCIDFCKLRVIRRRGDEPIFLLKLTQLNGTHAELFSYYTYVKYLSKSVTENELAPFTNVEYINATDTSESPTIVLSTNTQAHQQGPSLRVVTNRQEKGYFFLRINMSTEHELSQLSDLHGFSVDTEHSLTMQKKIHYTAIRREIKRIAVLLQPIV